MPLEPLGGEPLVQQDPTLGLDQSVDPLQGQDQDPQKLPAGDRQSPGYAAERARIRAENEERQRHFMATFRVASRENADMAARVQTTARKLGVDQETALHSPEVADEMLREDAAQLQTMARDYPALWEQMQRQEFVAVAHDDLDNLRETEGTLSRLGRHFSVGMLTNEAGWIGLRRAFGQATQAELDRLDEIDVLTRRAAEDKTSGWLASPAEILGQQAQTLPIILGAGAAAAAPSIVTGPGSVAAFGAGATAAVFGTSAAMEAGNEYNALRARGIPHKTAMVAAFGYGLAAGGVEAGLGFKYLKAPFGAAFSKGVAGGAVSTLERATVKGAWGQFVREAAKTWAAETGTEMIQTGMSFAAEQGALAAEGLPGDRAGELGRQLWDTFVQMGEGMFALSLPGPGLHLLADTARSRAAQEHVAYFTRLTASAEASKLRERDPAAYSAAVDTMARTHGVEDYHVDARVLGEALAQADAQEVEKAAAAAGITPEQMRLQLPAEGRATSKLSKVLPDVVQQLRENPTGDVVITPGEFQAHLAGTDVGMAIGGKLRLGPDGMTLEQSSQHIQELDAQVKAMGEDIARRAESDKAFAASYDQVQQDVEEQLRRVTQHGAATLSPKDITDGVHYFSTAVASMAGRVGQLPHEFWQQHRLQIVGPDELAGNVGPGIQQGAVDSPEFKAWFGDSKVVDEKGAPLPLYHQTDDAGAKGILATGFDLNKKRARASDDAVPDGVFLKPDAKDIRVGGNRQIPLFAAIRSPLVVPARAALVRWARQDAEYSRLADEVSKEDAAGAASIEAISRREGRLPAADLAAHIQETDAVIGRVDAAVKNAAAAARARLTQLLRAAGHDGVVVERDDGSFGRSTKTVIALDPTQVKSPYNRGTFDPNDPNVLRQAEIPDGNGVPVQFFSSLLRGIEAVPAKASTAQGWREVVKGLRSKGQAKAEEVEWTGLLDWLAAEEKLGQKRIPKEAVVEFLRANGVRVQVVTLGSRASANVEARSEELYQFLSSVALRPTAEQMQNGVNQDLLDEVDAGGIVSAAETMERDGLEPQEILEEFVPEGVTLNEPEKVKQLMRAVSDAWMTRAGSAHGDDAQFATWTLPGGDNYREFLLRLGQSQAGKEMAEIESQIERLRDAPINRKFGPMGENMTPEQLEEAARRDDEELQRLEAHYAKLLQQRRPDPRFQSQHWQQFTNLLAHVRTTDRVSSDGRRVLFVEEVQSDWALAGRTEGFGGAEAPMPGPLSGYRVELRAERWFIVDPQSGFDVNFTKVYGTTEDKARSYAQHLFTVRWNDEHDDRVSGGTSFTPPGPFVTSDGWINLALKHVVLTAIREGYDEVAFVSGEQTVQRYGLRRVVRKIDAIGEDGGGADVRLHLHRGDRIDLMVDGAGVVTFASESHGLVGNKLGQVIGEELAQRILTTAPKDRTTVSFEGDALSVGGQGKIVLYDQIVPRALSAILKRIDGPPIGDVQVRMPPPGMSRVPYMFMAQGAWFVQHGDLRTGPFTVEEEANVELQKLLDLAPPAQAQMGFQVTPELRRKVQLQGGLSLFHKKPLTPEEQKVQDKQRKLQRRMAASKGGRAAAAKNAQHRPSDTLLTWLAKAGGLNVETAGRLGITVDSSVMQLRGAGTILRVFKRKGGIQGEDEFARLLRQAGFGDPRDETAAYHSGQQNDDIAAAAEMLSSALFGDEVHKFEYQQTAAVEQEAQRVADLAAEKDAYYKELRTKEIAGKLAAAEDLDVEDRLETPAEKELGQLALRLWALGQDPDLWLQDARSLYAEETEVVEALRNAVEEFESKRAAGDRSSTDVLAGLEASALVAATHAAAEADRADVQASRAGQPDQPAAEGDAGDLAAETTPRAPEGASTGGAQGPPPPRARPAALPSPDDDRNRGEFFPRTLTMLLHKKADLSTFLHETGHYWLTVLGDLAGAANANELVKGDMQALLDWFGVKDLATWQAMTLEQQRQHHEAFAYSFEVYLFDGAAPSQELQGLFARFSAWLRSFYGDIEGKLNAIYFRDFGKDLPILTGEVRAVMDRLVAGADAASRAEEMRGLLPLFQTQAESGMNAEEWADYQRDQQWQHEVLAAEVARKDLRTLAWYKGAKSRRMREIGAQAQARREEVRQQVQAEIEQEPLRKAQDMLASGKVPKIDRDLARSRLVSPELSSGRMERMAPWLQANGISPEEAAELTGFAGGGDALLRSMSIAAPIEEDIEIETARRMAEEYGDLATPESREQAVDEGLHSEVRARFVAIQLQHASKGKLPWRQTLAAAKEAARLQLEGMTLREIRPKAFAAAEARARREAQDAMRKGTEQSLATVTQAGLREMLQNQLARQALEASEEIRKAMRGWQWLWRSDKEIVKTRDLDRVQAARAILTMFGLGAQNERAMEYLERVREYDPTLHAQILPLIERARTDKKNYRDLSLTDFRALVRTVEALGFLAKRDREIRVGATMERVETALEALHQRLDELPAPKVQPGQRQALSKGQKFGRWLNNLKALLRRVEHWARATDGPGTSPGPFTRYLWRPISQAVDHYRIERNRVVKAYVDLVTKLGPLPSGKIAAPELGYTFGAGNGGIGKAELLGAMQHAGNLSNLRKLVLGRFADATLGDIDAQWAEALPRWQKFVRRMLAEGHLTRTDFQFLQATWDLNESLKPEAQKAHHELFGYYFVPVKAEPFTVTFQDGTSETYRGGYVPAKADKDLSRDAQVHQKLESLEADFQAAMPSTGMGFTFERVEVFRPLSLDIRQQVRHIDDVVRFIYVQPAIRDTLKILRNQEFAAALTARDHAAIEQMLLPWLQRAARQTTREQGMDPGVDRFWIGVRHRTALATMFANVQNAFQQVTGLFISALKVKGSFLRPAMWDVLRDQKGTAKRVAEASKFMRDRLQNQVFDLAEALNDVALKPGRFDKLQDWSRRHAYFLQRAFQNTVDKVTWIGAYNQAIDELGGGDAVTDEAVARADAAVRQTQGSIQPEDIAKYQAGTPFMQTLTQFSGYWNMLANVNADEFIAVVRDLGWRNNKARLFQVYVLAFLAPMLVSDAIAGGLTGQYDDDDDDGYGDEIASWFFGGHGRGLAAMVPVFGPALAQTVTSIGSRFGGGGYAEDRMSTSPSIRALEAVYGIADTTKRLLTGKDLHGADVRDVATVLSLALGLPVSTVARPVSYLTDVARGGVEPYNAVDLVRGALTGRAAPGSRRP